MPRKEVHYAVILFSYTKTNLNVWTNLNFYTLRPRESLLIFVAIWKITINYKVMDKFLFIFLMYQIKLFNVLLSEFLYILHSGRKQVTKSQENGLMNGSHVSMNKICYKIMFIFSPWIILFRFTGYVFFTKIMIMQNFVNIVL